MEIDQIKNIWQGYDTKLEKSMRLNLLVLEKLQTQKVRSRLKILFLGRCLEVGIHIVVISWLISFLTDNFEQIQFSISASALIIFFVIALTNSFKQIIRVKKIDYSNSVIDIQRHLSVLRTHIINYIRLSFLVLPTYLAYPIIFFKAYVNIDITSRLSHNWWVGQLIFLLIMTPVSIWLYYQVTPANIHKKWVRAIIGKSAGAVVIKAMEDISEVDEFKKEADYK